MVLPLLKLGTLALKTLAKPIAGTIKAEAGKHPKFRNYIIRMAQVVFHDFNFIWYTGFSENHFMLLLAFDYLFVIFRFST